LAADHLAALNPSLQPRSKRRIERSMCFMATT